MKILLLTDIPPCNDFTAGIVLDRLCRFLPKGSVVCYAVVNRTISPRITPDLNVLIEYQEKPTEAATRVFPGLLGEFIAERVENMRERQVLKTILPRVVTFGRENGVDKVWCVLQGQTMIRLAVPVAKEIGVPLYVQVWDPFGWWLRANKIDSRTKAKLLNAFDSAIRACRSCATASWAMSSEYSAKYGVKNVPVISGLDRALVCRPKTRTSHPGEFLIGMAGQIYATQEWNALIRAIDKCKWLVNGKKIKFVILSHGMPAGVILPKNVEYLGWLSQKDAIKALSIVDILYLPYWFSSKFSEEARLSFPSKLITYFASGRPVFFHGPEHCSPAEYLKKNNAGFFCHSLELESIYKRIEFLAKNVDLCREIAENGTLAFLRDFTFEKMKEDFFRFLELTEA